MDELDPSLGGDAGEAPMILNDNNLDVKIKKACYYEKHPGPYIVYIREYADKTKHIFDKYKGIEQITPVQRGKLLVKCSSIETANDLAMDAALGKDYNIYIPSIDVEVQGVIILDLESDAEVVAKGEGKFKDPRLPRVKIVRAERLNSMKSGSLCKTNSVRITFEGKILPDYVAMGQLLLPLRSYTPKPKVCDKCKSYNHSSKYCTRSAVCSKCGDSDHTEDKCTKTSDEIKCADCKGNHIKGNNNCEFYKRIYYNKSIGVVKGYKKSFAEIMKAMSSNEETLPGDEPNKTYEYHPKLFRNPYIKNNNNVTNKRRRINSSDNDDFLQASRQTKTVQETTPRRTRIEKEEVSNVSVLGDAIIQICEEIQLPKIFIKIIKTSIIPKIDLIFARLENALFGLVEKKLNAE